MLRLFLFFILFCNLAFFIGCQEDSSLTSQQSRDNISEVIPLSDNFKTPFAGRSDFVKPLAEGTVTQLPNGMILIQDRLREWYDTTDDMRVCGTSIWVVNQLVDAEGNSRLWGTAEIFVDNDEYKGKWQLSWWGTSNSEGVLAKAIGSGEEGDVSGMLAKWTYDMNFERGVYYEIDGFMINR